MFDVLLLSAEHASNRIPARYARYFETARPALDGHQGYDPGAGRVARFLARRLGAPLFEGRWSRLLVDLNRSPHHRALFSEYLRDLSDEERQRILDRYYYPYRTRIEGAVRRELGAGRRVLHISVHSFTPILGGEPRHADIGLLYDPGRRMESDACRRLAARLPEIDRTLRVRRNYPYRGTADGLTTHLRRATGSSRYAGIEVEINQKKAGEAGSCREVARVLETAIRRELGLSR